MKLLLVLLVLFTFYGCKQQEKIIQLEKFSTSIVKDLVSKAINNDSTSNKKLSNLIDYSSSEEDNYNSIIIDSILTSKDTLYFIILENSNPLYNRFAVYNSSLTPLLIDKSLNGNIFFEIIKPGKYIFIKIDEAYLSKDILALNRVSLYSVDSLGVVLTFRTKTKFTKPGNEFFQDITEISDSLIRTTMRSLKNSPINGKKDFFIFYSSTKKYSSLQNIFDEFIKSEIEIFDYNPVKKQITDSQIFN